MLLESGDIMIKTENECVGCPDGLPCLYELCPYWAVTRLCCDQCDDEVETLYWWGNEQLCLNCIEKQLERVDIDD